MTDDGVDELDFSRFVFPSLRGVFRFTDLVKSIEKPVIFEKAEFRGGVEFDNFTFEADVDFHGATFGGKEGYVGPADFKSCTFKAEASFLSAQFIGGSESNLCAQFDRAAFLGRARFNHSTFKEWAAFNSCTFKSEVSFAGADFGGRASFSSSHFLGNADFKETVFDQADFTGTSFSAAVDFVGTKFPSEISPAESSVLLVKGVYLRDVEFADPEKVQFRGLQSAPLNLCAVSFLSTDVEKVVFVDETWGTRRGPMGLMRRNVLMDEELIRPSERYLDHPSSQSLPSYEKVMQQYRRLRKNYEAAGRYAEAGDFFVGEMEMRRLNVKPRNRFVRWLACNLSFIALYKHLSLYGESYRRIVAWSVALIAAFTVLRIVVGPASSEAVTLPVVVKCLEDSIAAFLQLPRGDSSMDLAERILSAPLIGLLLVSLKRRFERK